jgi:hypothetical protein
MRKFSTLSNGKCVEIKPNWPCPGTGVFKVFYRMAFKMEGDPCWITQEVCGYYYNEFDNETDKQLMFVCEGDKKVFDAIVQFGKKHWGRVGECDTNWKAFNSALEETICLYVDYIYPINGEY